VFFSAADLLCFLFFDASARIASMDTLDIRTCRVSRGLQSQHNDVAHRASGKERDEARRIACGPCRSASVALCGGVVMWFNPVRLMQAKFVGADEREQSQQQETDATRCTGQVSRS
jgi:ferric-dicitrate binding protein FerR (iron transport regulator)